MATSKTKIKAIISDFDGVICNQNFFETLKKKNNHLYEAINIFFKTERNIVNDWMRAKMDYHEFCQILTSKLREQINFDIDLEKELLRSVRRMTLNKKLLKFYGQLKKQGVKTALYTDNMDVFNLITVPHHHLEKYFDEIVDSYSLGELKWDNDSDFFYSLVEKLDTKPEEILILEDNGYIKENLEKQGFNFYQFYRKDNYPESFQKFKKYFAENIEIINAK